MCNKSFPVKGALVRHEQVHSRVNPFACPRYGKAFSSKFMLKMHERRHNGEKPFICSVCDGFCSNGELQAHVKRHTDEKPFHCSFCNKGFTTAPEKRRHEKIHTSRL